MFLRIIWTLLRSSILAGICIGIAGFGFLMSKDIVGTVLFTFGLLAVVNYGFRLFTGTVGFCGKHSEEDHLAYFWMPVVLIGNIIGTYLVSRLTVCSPSDLGNVAQGILQSRLDNGYVNCGVLSIGCGFIMTVAVRCARTYRHWLPIVFGVPIFIVCGFPHCIADAFYYLSVPYPFLMENLTDVLILYASIVIGNIIGCNLIRLILPNK